MLMKLINFLSSIADKPENTKEEKQEHIFLIYLGIAMSGGGLTWGTILVLYGIDLQSLIPYSYTLITLFNFLYLYKSKNFEIAKNVQVSISLLTPVLLQLSLGGFIASGSVILWSIPIILINFTFQENQKSLLWFYSYLFIVLLTGALDSTAAKYAIEVPRDVSILFFTLNLTLVSSVIFILFYYFIIVKENLKSSLEELNSTLEDEVARQVGEVTKSTILFKTIFNTVEDSIAIVDLNSNILVVNDTFEKFTNRSKDFIYTQSLLDLADQEMENKIKKVFDVVIKKGSYRLKDQRYVRADEKVFYFNLTLDLMPDKNTILFTAKDITQEKEYELERVEQENILLQHSRMAQMGEMISMIAHQWRQPLSAIASTASNLKLMLMLESLDFSSKEAIEESREYLTKRLDNVDEYVSSLTTTIDDFRNFYKPNKKPITTSLKSIVEKSLNIIEAALEVDKIKVVKEYDNVENMEIFDSEMMQVVLNILKNSQDNFNEKKIENPYIKIVIEGKTISFYDNGGGIPEDIIPSVFDPYFSTKSEKNGTGLGLHMSKIIVEEHHKGNLSVKNTPDGVHFSIKLWEK